jgi:hypothetical protein
VTDAPLSAKPFAEGDFRAGHVISRTVSVLSRNLLPFSLVSAVANVPDLLISAFGNDSVATSAAAVWAFLGAILTIVLNALSEAIVVYGAFEDMRGRRVDLMESTRIGLRRFFPVLGVALGVAILTGLASLLFIIPGIIVFTRWFVAMPACVVEKFGVSDSMGRSSELTKGHRWKIFGLWLVVIVAGTIVEGAIDDGMRAVAGAAPALVLGLVWSAVWGAFYSIMVVVTYHDLRVAKEGVDTDQIAAVFD